MTTLIGVFHTPAGGYGTRQRLAGGTELNVVTIFSGPGLAADTEIEANRPLTEEERDAVLDVDGGSDCGTATCEYDALPFQHSI